MYGRGGTVGIFESDLSGLKYRLFVTSQNSLIESVHSPIYGRKDPK